jgi:hypothetical protein
MPARLEGLYWGEWGWPSVNGTRRVKNSLSRVAEFALQFSAR